MNPPEFLKKSGLLGRISKTPETTPAFAGFPALCHSQKSLLSGALPVFFKKVHVIISPISAKTSPSETTFYQGQGITICRTWLHQNRPSCRGNRRWPPAPIADQDPYLPRLGRNHCRWLEDVPMDPKKIPFWIDVLLNPGWIRDEVSFFEERMKKKHQGVTQLPKATIRTTKIISKTQSPLYSLLSQYFWCCMYPARSPHQQPLDCTFGFGKW